MYCWEFRVSGFKFQERSAANPCDIKPQLMTESRMFNTFRGWRGLLLLTIIVGLAAFVLDFAYGTVVFGFREAETDLVQKRMLIGLPVISFLLALIFWLRFWKRGKVS